MRFYIYGLIDPRDYAVRYVGKTNRRIDSRVRLHRSTASTGKPTRVATWLRQLGREPWLVCLESGNEVQKAMAGRSGVRYLSSYREALWAKRFRRTIVNAESFTWTWAWRQLVNPKDLDFDAGS